MALKVKAQEKLQKICLFLNKVYSLSVVIFNT